MKTLIKIVLLFFFAFSFSQEDISYEKVLSRINNSSKMLCTSLIIPNNEFYVGIYTHNWEVEDLTEEQCGDVKTDTPKNSKFIELLNSNKLLTDLYLEMENNSFESINSSKKFEWNEMSLIIKLDFSMNVNEVNQVFVPIKNKKQAKKIINSICKIFNESKYCFKKLKKNLN